VFKIFLEIRNLPYLTVSPTSVKRFITGRGDAEKALVASEIKRRYAISFAKDPGNDLSDAAALALWGLLTKGSSHD
jgi:Holliday junction resolvasome RuvABC endonuclease subunit